jgi:hypothetical protein
MLLAATTTAQTAASGSAAEASKQMPQNEGASPEQHLIVAGKLLNDSGAIAVCADVLVV